MSPSERPTPDPELKKRARGISKRLAKAIPTPVVELDFDDPWQLLMATIMAAQSTDKTVNRVGVELFDRFTNPAELANAEPAVVEEIIHPTGFFRNKTKAIQAASRAIVEVHGGKVPNTMAELVRLPGVARKTANVILGKAFGVAEGIVVDVHCTRVSKRLGFTEAKDAKHIEADLMSLFPKKDWIGVGNRLVLHGRYVCTARNPNCSHCPLAELCPEADGPVQGRWTKRAERVEQVVMSRGEEKF